MTADVRSRLLLRGEDVGGVLTVGQTMASNHRQAGRSVFQLVTGPGPLRSFDLVALHLAMDRTRRARELTWNGVTRAIWEQSAVLNRARGDRPISRSTISNFSRRGSLSCQSALVLLRWLRCPPERFLAGPGPLETSGSLPAAGPDARLRWDLPKLVAAVADRMEEEGAALQDVALALGCGLNQLESVRRSRFAVDIDLVMRIVQWLGRPSSSFMYAARW